MRITFSPRGAGRERQFASLACVQAYVALRGWVSLFYMLPRGAECASACVNSGCGARDHLHLAAQRARAFVHLAALRARSCATLRCSVRDRASSCSAAHVCVCQLTRHCAWLFVRHSHILHFYSREAQVHVISISVTHGALAFLAYHRQDGKLHAQKVNLCCLTPRPSNRA